MRKVHPFYVGIDMSLVEPGISWMTRNQREATALKMPKHTTFRHPTRRFKFIVDEVINEIHRPLKNIENCHIVLEDYAAGAKGKTNQIAECTGLLKYRLFFKMNLPYQNLILCSVQHNKMFTCGKGNAKKELMLVNVYKKWGLDTNNNNVADAYSLMKICEAYFNEEVPLTEYQKDIINRIKKYNGN